MKMLYPVLLMMMLMSLLSSSYLLSYSMIKLYGKDDKDVGMSHDKISSKTRGGWACTLECICFILKVDPSLQRSLNKYLSKVLFKFSMLGWSTPLLQARKLPLKSLRIMCAVSLSVESMHSSLGTPYIARSNC